MTDDQKLEFQNQINSYLDSGHISDSLPDAALELAKDCLQSNNDLEQSLYYYDIAVKAADEIYGPEASDTLLIKNNFGVALNNSDNYSTSEGIFEELLEIRNTLYPDDVTNLVVTRVNLALAKLNLKKYDGLDSEYENLLKLNKEHLKNELYERIILGQYSDLLYKIEEYEKAYTVAKKYHSLCVKEQGEQSWKAMLAKVQLGDICYYYTTMHTEGIYFYQEALKTLVSEFPNYKYKIMSVKYSLAQFYMDILQDKESATDYFTQIINEYPENTNKNDYHYRTSLIYLADILITEKKDLERASSYLNEALQLIKDGSTNLPNSLSDIFYHFARLFILQGEKGKSVQAIEYAIKIISDARGYEHWRAKKFLKFLKDVEPNHSLLENYDETDSSKPSNNYKEFINNELYSKTNRRSIRVFISSTFKDMMNEREYLMKKIFPQFRRMCNEKGVEFTEVDLRWGVTEEDALKGKVIEICLNEIDKSRPYFIGILGERYGWIPDYKEYSRYKNIIENYSWVKKDLKNELSITEMEIQYGVLRNPNMNNNAFFYLRDKKLTPPGSENKEKHNSKEYKKLKELKKYLSQQKDYPVKNFQSIEELGQQILDDLINNVLSRYENTNLEPYELHRLQQVSYLKNYLKGFVGRESIFKELDEFISGNDQQLVLSGPSGIGKTAILSNWLFKRIKKNKDSFYLFHFTEGNSESTDYRFVLNRLLNELKLEYGIKESLRDDSPTPSEDFNKFLSLTDNTKQIVIVIDGLEKIHHHNFFAKLHWFPSEIPPHVKIITAVRDGELLDKLLDLNYSELKIESLRKQSRQKFINEYLGLFGKALPNVLSSKIVEDDVSNSPLTLRAVLDELRIFGIHEKLEHHLNRFLVRNGAVELFDEILTRIEEDYGMENPELIGEALSLVSISKAGLSENELVEITKIPKMQWSPIYSSLETYFVNSSGKLNILNDYLNEAIKLRYISVGRKIFLHKKLVKFFKAIDSPERKYAELGYHLYHSNDKSGLKDYLTDLNIFNLYSRDNVNEFFKYWETIGSDYSLVDEYLKSFNNAENSGEFNPIELAELAVRLAQFVAQYYKPDAEFYFLDKAYKLFNANLGDNHPRVVEIINRLGSHFLRKKEYKIAKNYLKKVVKWIEKNSQLINFQKLSAYHDLASIAREEGKYDEAENYILKAISHAERIGGKNNLAIVPSLMNLAEIYKHREDYIKSYETLKSALEINKRYAGDKNVATGLNYQAIADICFETENYEETLIFVSQALEIYRNTVGENSMYTLHSLHIYGMTEYLLKNYDSAVELLGDALSIAFNLLEEDQALPIKREMTDVLQKIGEIEKDDELLELVDEINERLDAVDG